jgi:cyclopropane-fatty-acyl-phospholipid synthase
MIDTLLARGILPDPLIRLGIRRLLGARLREQAEAARSPSYLRNYADDLRGRPIAEHTREANTQHYEVPAEFFERCLGRRLKYSSCFFEHGTETLDQGEEAMLALYVERAQLRDGQAILELGCGWGSLSLYLAERFPAARITSVSNSAGQRRFIEARARALGLGNLRVLTCDMNTFEAENAGFDRVVSVEMFEHMKNYQELLARVARWLKPAGKVFIHIFTHDRYAYHFEAKSESDWMARHFFTGGQMPSHDLLPRFQDDVRLLRDWKVNGKHYQRTAELWLQNMDRHREPILALFRQVYGEKEAARWFAYWRVFYLACAELWGYRGGDEWIVSHYLFERPAARTGAAAALRG